ncbi:MAG TPA: sensor domain-containing protein [Candidatus Stackebrandtia excrementipullorum]|nr:sensor domain-containing protein [Candidatus Stackebrandtia excrementipullorum]
MNRIRQRLRIGATALQRLVWTLGTASAALLTLLLGVLVAAVCLVGVGLPLIRPWLLLLRMVADLERRRLTAMGHPIVSAYPPLPRGLRAVPGYLRHDPTVRRDLAWLPIHAVWGWAVGAVGVQIGVNVVRDLTFPLWWYLLPLTEASLLNGLVSVTDWGSVWWAILLGLVWSAMALFLNPVLVTAAAVPGRRLLSPHPDLDLSARIVELTATRAAALDAHVVELRRIERALHDGAQNRLVGVAMLTGAARDAISRDTAAAEAIMERAHEAAEQALAELRTVVRGILPPVLEDRGLEGAVYALASDCAVEVDVDVRLDARCPISVETTAYFAVAEALTNVSKHSEASRAHVTVRRTGEWLVVRITDDGRGGARVDAGTGLAGIERRVAGHDGTTRIVSPVSGPTTVEVRLPCGS